LFEKPSDGSEPERLLYGDRHIKIAESVSPDGQYLTYWVNDETSANHSRDIWVLPLRGKRTPFPLTQTPYSESQSQFSPDGRWVAYNSDESGQREVYVVPFPGPGAKVKVSADGGVFPRWNRNGHELFFVGPQRTLSVASVRVVDGRFNVVETHPLFDLRLSGPAVYDVAPDGQRFLVHTRDREPAIAPITLVVNWPFLLKH
jgi:Tol biopolymer transport system component